SGRAIASTRLANSAAWPSACWSICTSEGLRPAARPPSPRGRRGARRRPLRLPPETPSPAGGHAAPPVVLPLRRGGSADAPGGPGHIRSEEHTSELQSRSDLVCRLLLEKKKKKTK